MKKGGSSSSNKILHYNLSIEFFKEGILDYGLCKYKDILRLHIQANLPIFVTVCLLTQVSYYFKDKEIYFTHYKFFPKQRAILLKCYKFIHVRF